MGACSELYKGCLLITADVPGILLEDPVDANWCSRLCSSQGVPHVNDKSVCNINFFESLCSSVHILHGDYLNICHIVVFYCEIYHLLYLLHPSSATSGHQPPSCLFRGKTGNSSGFSGTPTMTSFLSSFNSSINGIMGCSAEIVYDSIQYSSGTVHLESRMFGSSNTSLDLVHYCHLVLIMTDQKGVCTKMPQCFILLARFCNSKIFQWTVNSDSSTGQWSHSIKPGVFRDPNNKMFIDNHEIRVASVCSCPIMASVVV
ncbi:hypothetical protein SLA2020_206240 [Shorea laevis]